MTGAPSLANRIATARRRAFVGREAEIELFVHALEAIEPAFVVLFVHGPGGVGKSSLLDQLHRETSERGIACHRLERGTGATPDAFLRELGLHELDGLTQHDRLVLLVDTYEELGMLDRWLREELVPALPPASLVVIAGRERPSPEWRMDPGLASLVRVRALENLSPAESAALLASRGVEARADAVHALTHGHPLALALAAEILRDSGAADLPELTPDVVRVLLDRIVRSLPDEAHRRALEVAALARVVTADLLRDLGVVPALYDFLRGLSYARETAEGLVVHDLVRDAITAELGFRDPSARRELREAIGARARAVIARATGRARERAFYDLLFGMRSDPHLRRYYDWNRTHGTARALRETELESALDDLRRYEGDESAALAKHWWQRQPAAFVALEDAERRYLGFVAYLRLRSFDRADRHDPIVAPIERLLASAPLRDGEHFTVLRFWVWRDAYQDLGSAAHHPHSMHLALDWMSSPLLGRCFVVVQRVEIWRSFLPEILFLEEPGHELTVGAHRYSIFSRDFRLAPWGANESVRGRQVLARGEFEAALRRALRTLSRPDELSVNPLMRTRLLTEWAEGEPPRPEMIRELVEVALSSMTGDDDRPRRAVDVTFLRGVPTQEAAAERLGLSFSTYRRQLERGVVAVADYLWTRELGRG